MPRQDSRWYQDAVFYELHVRAFYDDNGDGIGDFAGLTQKLDYLEWLGVDCLWLLPFYPSPCATTGTMCPTSSASPRPTARPRIFAVSWMKPTGAACA